MGQERRGLENLGLTDFFFSRISAKNKNIIIVLTVTIFLDVELCVEILDISSSNPPKEIVIQLTVLSSSCK